MTIELYLNISNILITVFPGLVYVVLKLVPSFSGTIASCILNIKNKLFCQSRFLSLYGTTKYYIFMTRDINRWLCINLFIYTIFYVPQGNYVGKLQDKIRRKNCCLPALTAMQSGMPNRDEILAFNIAKSTVPLQIKTKQTAITAG